MVPPNVPRHACKAIIILASMLSIMLTKSASGVAGTLAAPNSGFSLMAQDDVLEHVDQRLWDFFTQHALGDGGFVLDPDGAFDEVADEMAAVAIAEACFVNELPGLGDVVEEKAGEDEIAI